MKVEQAGFTPLSFQDGNNIQRAQPSVPQSFPDISKIQAPEETTQPGTTAATGVQSKSGIQGSALSHYLSSDEKEMLNRLFPTTGKLAGIQAYQQTTVAAQPQDVVLGQRIDITT